MQSLFYSRHFYYFFRDKILTRDFSEDRTVNLTTSKGAGYGPVSHGWLPAACRTLSCRLQAKCYSSSSTATSAGPSHITSVSSSPVTVITLFIRAYSPPKKLLYTFLSGKLRYIRCRFVRDDIKIDLEEVCGTRTGLIWLWIRTLAGCRKHGHNSGFH
jgi:hypothetical protein